MSQDDYLLLQRAIYDQGYRWRAGPTSLSALPAPEQQVRLGLRLEPRDLARIATAMIEAAPQAAEHPDTWDWRDAGGENWTTPIRDQRGCGACVAFAAVAVLESMVKLHFSDATLQPDLSEAHLFFCGCGACCSQGWWPNYALDYARDYGVPDEASFPYQDHNMSCSDSSPEWQNRAVKVVGWQEVTDVGARKEWLSTQGPMLGCMAVYQDFFAYTGGVYRHTLGGLSGYHAVGVVGFSEEDQAWICKNSWGANWGDSGWFRIAYGQCGMDTQFAMYGVEGITPPSPDPSPPPPPPPDPPPDPDPGCNMWARLRAAVGGSNKGDSDGEQSGSG